MLNHICQLAMPMATLQLRYIVIYMLPCYIAKDIAYINAEIIIVIHCHTVYHVLQ